MITIDNFSMTLGEVVYCTSLVDLSVDIIDPIFPVTTSGTYLTVNGVEAVTSLVSITDGYRLAYSTVPSGNMLIYVRGSNISDDVTERYYDLRFGYEAKWEKVVNWGNDREVPVSVVASNTSTADNTSNFATFFTTRGNLSSNFEATIAAEGSGFANLGGEIHPQGKYFMYGKTYTITVSGIRDFSGNILPKKTYSFTIEELV